MIEFVKAFKTSSGVFNTLEEAQAEELRQLLAPAADEKPLKAEEAAEILIANASKVLDILTTTKDSRPKARKVNGGSKTRRPKVISASETAA